MTDELLCLWINNYFSNSLKIIKRELHWSLPRYNKMLRSAQTMWGIFVVVYNNKFCMTIICCQFLIISRLDQIRRTKNSEFIYFDGCLLVNFVFKSLFSPILAIYYIQNLIPFTLWKEKYFYMGYFFLKSLAL